MRWRRCTGCGDLVRGDQLGLTGKCRRCLADLVEPLFGVAPLAYTQGVKCPGVDANDPGRGPHDLGDR